MLINICFYYHFFSNKASLLRGLNGAPDLIRTGDLQSRSLLLYPAELRALVATAETALCFRRRATPFGENYVPSLRRSSFDDDSLRWTRHRGDGGFVTPPLQNRLATLDSILILDGDSFAAPPLSTRFVILPYCGKSVKFRCFHDDDFVCNCGLQKNNTYCIMAIPTIHSF